MYNSMTRSWGWVLVRGILAVLFGLAAFFLPLATTLALVTLFGAFVLVDGIFAVIAAFRLGSESERWWPLLFEGLLGIVVGVLAFVAPAAMAAALVYLAAAWAILTGVLEIASAVRLRRVIDNEIWLAVTGVLSILFGIVLFVMPLAGVIAWAWCIGFYALLYGVATIALAVRLHSHTPRGMTHRAA